MDIDKLLTDSTEVKKTVSPSTLETKETEETENAPAVAEKKAPVKKG